MNELDSNICLQIPKLGDFSETEATLREFYRSGEPETTTNYFFPSFHCALTLMDSGKGLGLFLKDRAVPGQLLILCKAISSCECIRQCTPYQRDSCVRDPNENSLPPLTRIPTTVNEHLAYHLGKTITTSNTNIRAQINLLDSHQSQKGESLEVISERRLLKGRREIDLAESESNKLEVLDLEDLRNIISNNAMCDKVRSINLNESRAQVITNHLWGLWVIPSWINHSCSPNCHRMRIGNDMIIRAATGIEAEDELTLPYFDIFHPLLSREMSCSAFHFRCDCRRCTFERSMGKPYEDIQQEFLDVTTPMHGIWRSPVADGILITNTLLKLTLMALPIETLLIGKIGELKNQNQQSLSAKQDLGVLPISNSELASQAASEHVWKWWILASFMDVFIAGYSLCETGFFNVADPSVPRRPLVNWPEGLATNESEQATRTLRVVASIESILNIVENVHPGNVLGQEFYSILLSDLKENLADNFDRLQFFQSKALRFFAAYYGFAGTEILRMLVEGKDGANTL